jgi:hypothetical protein
VIKGEKHKLMAVDLFLMFIFDGDKQLATAH